MESSAPRVSPGRLHKGHRRRELITLPLPALSKLGIVVKTLEVSVKGAYTWTQIKGVESGLPQKPPRVPS